ncbi:hypothetical protein KSP39_PZI020566 [Platanthera zijinensis]|uniref:Plantacyanin n=1 Tax=Platanthera zijinensis TaxID=2320716 RepID=A0AAP0B0A6_9ASPA
MGVTRVSAICLLVVSLSILSSNLIAGHDYVVGDSKGWNWGFNGANWVKGKKFKAGDILVFRYNPAAHYVVKVNIDGYKSCSVVRDGLVYLSGNDRVKLTKGTNYFICTNSNYCAVGGMKLFVMAK